MSDGLPTQPQKGAPGWVRVKVSDIEAYDARWQKTRDNQRDSINRLLEKIKELEETNRRDAAEIARLTGVLVTEEERSAALQVELDLLKGTPDFTSTSEQAVWHPRHDAEEVRDEAEVALDAIEATLPFDGPPIVPGELPEGEERPASGWDALDDNSPGRHASLT